MRGSLRALNFWFTVIITSGIVIFVPALLMRVIVSSYLYSSAENMPRADAALVLGASVVNGELSPVLRARADAAAKLYEHRRVDLVLVTGAVEPNYDEVTPVRDYLLSKGVPSSDIVLDRSGEDTFTSMFRARNVFLVRSLVIVTQDFHLPRAVYIARTMQIESFGLAAPRGGNVFDYLREVLAAWKAIADIVLKRTPGYAYTPTPLRVGGFASI